MATTMRWRPIISASPRSPRPPPRCNARSFRRGDFNSFSRRVSSGEALRDALRGANRGLETLLFEARRAAERLDRRFSISRRFDSAARCLDQELGIGRRWRIFSADFPRNFPRYSRELRSFFETPLGRTFATIFFLWFALSGWLFTFVMLATWILPFAAPLLIGTFTNSIAIEGSCPACKTRFIGYRNQTIRCASCRNIVWQPGSGFPGGMDGGRRPSANRPSERDIIDIEIEKK